MMKRLLSFLFLLSLIILALLWSLRPSQPTGVSAEITALQQSENTAGYAQADRPRAFVFPRDHGPHPEYQTEWWYYTGNLVASDGRRFGYQLTFFRRAITPTAEARTSEWATNQIYFAHFAISDIKGNTHFSTERFSRGAAGLAGATGEPTHTVWIEDWRVREIPNRNFQIPTSKSQLPTSNYQLHAKDYDTNLREMSLDLILHSEKPPTLHGDAGLSQKTNAVGNASYYFSFTRMQTSGTVAVHGETYTVEGLSWMDHEFGTTGLGADAVGWDWFSLQLGDNRELMFFQIRQKDGSIEPLSSGTLVMPTGVTKQLTREQVSIQVTNRWTSRYSGATYPAGWTLTIPSEQLILNIKPYIADQELRVSFTYWEGAVEVSGTANGASVRGSGYVEMTGYAGAVRR
jgi:predicted secreted hydrolase